MPVDPNVHFFDEQRAGRRGFLMGITLAELMLIALFALLLLLRNSHDVAERFGGAVAMREASNMGEAIASGDSQRSLSDTWRVLTRKVRALASQPEQLDRWLDLIEDDPLPEIARIPGEHEALRDEIEDLRHRLAEASADLDRQLDETRQLEETLALERNDFAAVTDRAELLEVELARTREGGLVLCMYEPAVPNAAALRGRSVPLGSVHLEADGITLIRKNGALPGMRVVDYVGDAYDLNPAVSLLHDWPPHRKLSFEQFADYGRRFVALGNVESDKRQQCRFSMNYYIEDYVTPHSIFTDVFLLYFFRQSSLSRTEFERLRPASPASPRQLESPVQRFPLDSSRAFSGRGLKQILEENRR